MGCISGAREAERRGEGEEMGRKCKENGTERRRQREVEEKKKREKGSCSVSYPLGGDANCVSHTREETRAGFPTRNHRKKATERPNFWDKNHRI